MLRVPELRPDDTPFDPDFYATMNIPMKGPGGHILALAKDDADERLHEKGAILMGVENAGVSSRSQQNAKAEAERQLSLMYTLALVKDAVTNLHREGDEQIAKLAEYNGIRINDIVPDQKRFLSGQQTTYKSMFTDERQQMLFDEMTGDYFGMMLKKAENLRCRKMREYLGQVIDRQNAEFIARALNPENVFNDIAQRNYRDMILYNLENVFADVSEAERKKRLDAACETYYKKILEKRLELDPTRLKIMLSAPAVRRILGNEILAEYQERAAVAVKQDELRLKAKSWVDDGVDPKQAKKRLIAENYGKNESDTFLTFYNYWRYNKNRRIVLTRIVNLGKAWRAVKTGGMHPETIPNWVRRNDNSLYLFLLDEIHAHDANGGLPPPPKYGSLLDFTSEFDPYEVLEKLHDDEQIFTLVHNLGGPDADAFQIALRMLVGKVTHADQAWISDLALARDTIRRAQNDDVADAVMQAYLYECDTARRIRLEREGATELEKPAMREIIASCMSAAKGSGERKSDQSSIALR